MLGKLLKSWKEIDRDATACNLPEECSQDCGKSKQTVPMWEVMTVERAGEKGLDTSKEALMSLIIRSTAKLNDGVDQRDFTAVEDAAGDMATALCLLVNEYGLVFDDCLWMAYGWMDCQDWGKPNNG